MVNLILSCLKRSVLTVFRPHENSKLAFSNPSGLRSVYEKLRFRDRLLWTEGQAVEIKLHVWKESGVNHDVNEHQRHRCVQ